MHYLVIHTADQISCVACFLGNMDPRTPRSRYRSSTSASSTPIQDTPSGNLAILLSRLSKYSDYSLTSLHKIKQDLEQLIAQIDAAITPNPSQDNFRRSQGFQTVLNLLRAALKPEDSPNSARDDVLLRICNDVLVVISSVLKDHHGNRRYFARRVLGDGWSFMHKTLEAFVSRLPSESLVNENSEAVLGLIQ